MNSSTDLLKGLQVQFLKAAARWTNYGTEVEAASLGLPNLVCLLQSVGYSIRRIDSVSPEETTPLRNNQKGTRVIVTCGHSGQRCYLELPEEAEQCTCKIKNKDNSQDSFWEVTATNPASRNSSLIETGSDAVPSVSKELNILLKQILLCLTHMIQGTLKDVEAEEAGLGKSTSSSNTSSPKKGAKRLSGFLQEMVNVPIIISSPQATDAPTRYGSLDTLNDRSNEGIPPPGLLTPKITRTKETVITQSSPNINLFGKTEAASSSNSTIENPKSDTVLELLRKAISLLEVNKSQELLSPAIVSSTDKQDEQDKQNEHDKQDEQNKQDKRETTYSKTSSTVLTATTNTMGRKSASSPSLAMKKKMKSNSASRIPTTPTDGGRPGSTKLLTKFNGGVKTKSPQVDDERNICSKPKKVSNLYAHIKSTIPKASPLGSYVSKKS